MATFIRSHRACSFFQYYTAYPTYYQELYGPEETGITFEEVQLAATSEDPWYIYECLPFLRDLTGFPQVNSSGNSTG